VFVACESHVNDFRLSLSSQGETPPAQPHYTPSQTHTTLHSIPSPFLTPAI